MRYSDVSDVIVITRRHVKRIYLMQTKTEVKCGNLEILVRR